MDIMVGLRSALPERLVDARKRRRLTQKELSQLTGIATTSIAHFEEGSRLPSVENIVKLALGLKVSTDELLGMPKYPTYFDLLSAEQIDTLTLLQNHWLGKDSGGRV